MVKQNKVKKKKPQDSTLRNVRAANNKIAALEKRVKKLEQWCAALTEDMQEQRMIMDIRRHLNSMDKKDDR